MSVSREQQLLQIVEQDLQHDCRDYLDLREQMQALYEHLMRRDSAQIEQCNAQILPLVEQSKLRAERRSKVLAAFKLGAGHSAMLNLIERYPAAQRNQLHTLWQQLGQLAAQCKTLNERNGQLLAMHNEILQQLFNEPGSDNLYSVQPY